MQNLKQIELELWEPNPDKPAYLRFVGCRKAKEVFNELYAELQRLDLVPDEYFTMFFRIEEDTLVPKDARVVAYANWGGSEGIYIDVDLIGKDEALHLATGKTLSESTEAFDRMQYIAGVIYKMFTSPGFSASKLTIKSEMTNAEEKMWPDAVAEILKNMGYRYGVTWAKIIHEPADGVLKVELQLKNFGVAPMYFPWQVCLYLVDAQGSLTERKVLDVNLTKLSKDQSVDVKAEWEGESLKKKLPRIAIGIENPDTGKPEVLLDMDVQTQDKVYILNAD